MAATRDVSGFTLMELMMALAIGMLVMVGLVSTFVAATKAQKNVQQDRAQIENGRVAVEILANEIKMAGYYNSYYLLPASNGVVTVPAFVPDPCLVAPLSGAATVDNLTTAMAVHLQVYNAPSSGTRKPNLAAAGASSSCGGLLAASNLAAGSDVLVVRRASTKKVSLPAAVASNVVYLQTGAFAGELQLGLSSSALTTMTSKKATGAALTADMEIRDDGGARVAGDIYRYLTNIYFVAPCAVGSGTNGACAAGDDSIPTLKRLELSTSSGATAFVLVPMVEGIQAVAFDSGIDNSPAAVSSSTGFVGDGQPDVFKRDGHGGQTLSMADRANTVAMNVFVLARNTEMQMDHNDSKTYILTDNAATGAGSTSTFGAFGDKFRRHVYTARVAVENWTQRRENP